MHRSLIVTLLLWLVVSAGGALSQGAPALVVTLKDINERPVAGVRVVVRDSTGERDIARATTDTQGTTSFAMLNASDIRVAVEGQLKSGVKLFQPGNDARGMLVFLRSGTTHVDLLTDVDGLIAPDPRTMAALEPGIPVATAPTALLPTAPLAARPTATAIRAIPQPTFLTLSDRTGGASLAGNAVDAQAPEAAVSPALIWLGLGLLALFIGCGIGILIVLRPWRR
jgi:cell division protein YceG involved in septum cleavage